MDIEDIRQELIKAGVVTEELDEFFSPAFLDYSIKNSWDGYKRHCMDQKIIIQNAIKDWKVQLPNAKVGQDYEATVKLDENIEPMVASYELKGLDAISMSSVSVEKSENGTREFTIKGKPEKEGSFSLNLVCNCQGKMGNPFIVNKELNLIINPDPKTLWKTIGTNPNDHYFVLDQFSDFQGMQKPLKNILAASVRGRSHAQEGRPRDDHFLMEYMPQTGWYVMAVADGAGSAKYSRWGSRLACNKAVELCRSYIEGQKDGQSLDDSVKAQHEGLKSDINTHLYQLLGNAAFGASQVISEEANSSVEMMKANCPASEIFPDEARTPKDYSTTFLLAVCKKFEFGWAIATFWVGDGAICIFNAEKEGEKPTAKMMGLPDSGEYAGQTRFLTMPEIFKDAQAVISRIKFAIVPDFSALFLMTDGVSDPWFETDVNLENAEKWQIFWDNINKSVKLEEANENIGNRLVDWLGFWSPGNHDDRTLALLF